MLHINFTVVESFKSPKGKFANSYGNMMIIDWKYLIPDFLYEFKQNLIRSSVENIDEEYLDKLLRPIVNISISDYALEVDAVLRNRDQYYTNSKKVKFILFTEN